MVASPYLLHKIGLKFARSVLDKNLNPEQKLWREGVINAFSQRQVAWKEYDKLYKRMISEDNKIVRKIKRKEVDDFRKKVKSIPDILISTIVLSVFV